MTRANYPAHPSVIYNPPPFVYHRPFMTSILFRYIFKETAVPFLLGMAVFTFVLLMGRLLKLAEMVFAKGVPFLDVCRLILYMLPSFFLVSIPMAFLLAVLLAFGRLSSDSEITAIKASGISLGSLLAPVLTFGVLAYLATTFITVYALPWGNTSFKHFLYAVIETRAATTIKEKVFNDEFPGLVVYVDGYDDASHEISGILIHDERNPEEPVTIFASTGIIAASPEENNIRLHLKNGSIHRGIGASGYRLVEFNSYDLHINLRQSTKKDQLDEEDLTLRQLMVNRSNKQIDDRFRRDVSIELHKRFSLPFACIVFAVIGVPLGIQNQRSGRAGGFSAGIVILMLYYMLMSAGKTIAEKDILPPSLAVWLPNALFIAFGLYLLRLAAADRQIPLVDMGRALIGRARDWLRRWRKPT
ncbi:LPS export ABC transporter permease LptF [Geobacter sp.]|uniref:LPS export ABC transporter permease LptF n=1 Tax=Geobacter sp. TaxID=46610 RepID=UPI0027B96668|nr:LPS export ABC transporter permease LptF [Geobacter sp.]